MSAEIIPFVPRDYDPRFWPERRPKPAQRAPAAEFEWPCAADDTAPSEMNPQEPA